MTQTTEDHNMGARVENARHRECPNRMRSITLIMLLLPQLILGQENLVPNGGFESIQSCPDTEGWISFASPWKNIVAIGGGAELYNICSLPEISGTDTFPRMGIPENIAGHQPPYSGNGYAGFFAVSDPENYPNWREFIQTPLSEPLHPGVRYQVTFYVSLAEKFQYAVGSLGAHFSINPLQEAAYDILPDVTPQIQSPVGVIYDDKENWMEVRDTLYIPRSEDGGQQWMTIGNFLPDSLSQITFVDSGAAPNYDRSYYYIDDVSVVALDSVPSGVGITEQEAVGFEVWPNPATDVVRFRVGDVSTTQAPLDMTVRVLDAVGRVIWNETLRSTQDDRAIDISALPTGIYFLELTNTEGSKAVRKFVKE